MKPKMGEICSIVVYIVDKGGTSHFIGNTFLKGGSERLEGCREIARAEQKCRVVGRK